MKLFGIALRKPSFNEVTAATVMACGLWLACVGLLQAGGHPMQRPEAGGVLLILLWGSLGARLGIRVSEGRRHLMVNLGISALLLGLYQGACTLLG